MEPERSGHANEVIPEHLWSVPLLEHFQKGVVYRVVRTPVYPPACYAR
jgi:hypothetical protein